MKMSDSNKAILLVLVGIAVLAFSVMYFTKPNFEKKQSIDNECVQLSARLAQLQDLEANRETYEREIEEFTEGYQYIVDSFPADLKQEISIMFLQGIKDNNDFTLSSLGLGEKIPFYTMGSGGADASLATTETASSEEADVAEDTAADNAVADNTVAAGNTSILDESLICYSAAFPIDYQGSYKSLKDVVTYIDTYSDRMTVDTLSITYAGEGVYTGSLDLTCYSLEGDSRPERSIDLEQVEIGVYNIFEGGNATGKSDSSLNKYNENDGAAIETSYDFYVMLNPASSDVSAKVLGQNGTGKENTVISNSDNSSGEITYDFYEVDGKIYCKYVLNNSQSYEAEVTSAEDVKLLIQSSERKNDDDRVEARITIRNTTSLPIYVKVAGDDTVSPRVKITKTGSVKVYQ